MTWSLKTCTDQQVQLAAEQDLHQVCRSSLVQDLRFDFVYDEYAFNRNFIEWIWKSMEQEVCSFWSSKSHGAGQDVACYVTSLANLHRSSRSWAVTWNIDKQWICFDNRRSHIDQRYSLTSIERRHPLPRPFQYSENLTCDDLVTNLEFGVPNLGSLVLQLCYFCIFCIWSLLLSLMLTLLSSCIDIDAP